MVTRAAILIVLAISLFRVIVAARVPLTGDETYYWSWSRHLAFGYLDHPPMVAWLIAATSWLGHNSLAVRLPFIVCEALAALAVGRTAVILSGNQLAGTAATIVFTFIPQTRFVMGEALPDGSYLFFWSLALLLGARVTQQSNLRDFVLLGLALGGAILSRIFAWALIVGIVMYALAPARRVLWKRGLWLALLIAAALYAPFVVWNAAHGWANVAFSVWGRQGVHWFSIDRLSYFSTLRTDIFVVVLWIVAIWVAIRPLYPLLAWTALPLSTFFVLLSTVDTVESYWLLGPFTSLCVGIGIAYTRMPTVWKRFAFFAWIIPAVYTMAVVALWSLPESAQAAVLRISPGALKGPIYSEVFKYQPMSNDIRSLVRGESAVVVTDTFETASELLYNGVDSLIVGLRPQAAQWAMWHDESRVPNRVLVATEHQLLPNEELFQRLFRAFKTCEPGPTWHYSFAGTTTGMLSTIWCTKPVTNAAQILFPVAAK